LISLLHSTSGLCAPRLVLAQELREHALAVFGRELTASELDAENVGDRRRVDQVFA
jgi:hypothetical protein